MEEFKANYIKFNWLSDDENLIAKSKELERLLLSTYSRKPKKRFAQAFNVILTSFDVLNAYSGWHLFIATNHNLYYGKTRRDPTYTPEILTCLNWLISEGYLVQEAKRTATIESHRITHLPFRYSVTSKLSRKPLSNPKLIMRNPLAGYVQLRQDFTGGKRAISQTNELCHGHEKMIDFTEDLLGRYDDLMSATEITLGSKPVLSAQTSMTRIFSRGSFGLGGRLYSPIQALKSEARKYLRFNGEPTVEIDYSAIHPVMLYNIAGIEFKGDPYKIEGFPRNQVKLAFNIMLNRKGGKSAASTIVGELGIERHKAQALEKKIINRHKGVSSYFNSDYGLKLQNKDSALAMQLINLFVERDKPIIAIHDSFIVSVRDLESLDFAMTECFIRLFNWDASVQPEMKWGHLVFSELLTKFITRYMNGEREIFSTEEDLLLKLLNNEAIQELPEELNASALLETEPLE